jgi:putative transposase
MLTQRKRLELVELAARTARARDLYLEDYWSPKYFARVVGPLNVLVEERRARGWAAAELSPHQNKVALESAVGILRAHWAGAIATARRQLVSSPNWTSEDKSDALRLLKTSGDLARCLVGQDQNTRVSARLSRRVRRLVLARRGRRPRSSRRLWFDLDCNLYRPFLRPNDRYFRGAWIAVTGLTPGHRIKIPLAGPGVNEFATRTGRVDSRPSVRVEITDRVVFYMVAHVAPRERVGIVRAGLDKGYKTLITVTSGQPEDAFGYGVAASQSIDTITASSETRRRNRRRLASYERSIRNSASPKARRVRRSNLGAIRARRAVARDRAALRQQVNTALNLFFREHPQISSLAVEDLRFRGRASARPLNRRLARWLKGYLHERLAYKAELNGVELKVVSAAYTSQTCPHCWFASADNRNGDKFECGNCSYTGSADAVAATNILRRGSDSAITQFTPHAAVKQILDERWRSARNGRAWGSNGEASDSDAARQSTSDRAANNALVLQPGDHTAALYPWPLHPRARIRGVMTKS